MKSLLLLLLLVPFFSFSQTKRETEEWILSKLNSYVKDGAIEISSDGNTVVYVKKLTFKFEEYDRSSSSPGRHLVITGKFYETYKGKINPSHSYNALDMYVCKYKRINKNSQEKLTGHGQLYPILVIEYNAGSGILSNGTITFPYDVNQEEKLLDRLDKAFTHLKGLYCNEAF